MRQIRFPQYLLAISLVIAIAALAGCKSTEPAAVGEAPIAKASVEVINLHTTGAYPEFDGACQTNGLVEFVAVADDIESGSASGEPVVLEWSFHVDRGNGLEPSPDFGPGNHVHPDADTSKPMSERILAVNLLTIGRHEVTLTVRTRDGRASTTKLEVLVTSCEDCG